VTYLNITLKVPLRSQELLEWDDMSFLDCFMYFRKVVKHPRYSVASQNSSFPYKNDELLALFH